MLNAVAAMFRGRCLWRSFGSASPDGAPRLFIVLTLMGVDLIAFNFFFGTVSRYTLWRWIANFENNYILL